MDELNIENYNAIMRASILISKAIKLSYNPDGITVYQNGGVFNELDHYHMHVIPRYEGQSLSDFYKEDTIVEEIEEQYFKRVMNSLNQSINNILRKTIN